MKETVSDALWMGVLAGLGAVVIEAILLGSFYLFDPAAKKIIEDHNVSLVISFPVIFVAAFGFSLQFALEGQFWRGKWK
jgi:hypothetical protein